MQTENTTKNNWLYYDDQTIQDKGYIGFFTEDGWTSSKNAVPMRYAKATANRNIFNSSPEATEVIRDSYLPGAIHWADGTAKHLKGGKFIDFDIESAYASWLVKYAENRVGYNIGGSKIYYNTVKINNKNYDMLAYRIKFGFLTNDYQTSKLYRRWIIKGGTKQIKVSNSFVSGYILIPNIKDLVNRFLEDVQVYDEHEVEIIGTVVTMGYNAVTINVANLRRALQGKSNKHENDIFGWKKMLNSSTGYLAHADKLMYFTMVNHIRLILLVIEDILDQYYRDEIRAIAANTDGLTLWCKDSLSATNILNQISDDIYNIYGFRIRVKEVYDDAKVTPADVRKRADA